MSQEAALIKITVTEKDNMKRTIKTYYNIKLQNCRLLTMDSQQYALLLGGALRNLLSVTFNIVLVLVNQS